MTWFSPQKLAIFDPIQPRLYGSKVQKWSRTIIPYVWEVFWCNRSLKWAELWSQQPWEWPKRLKSEEKWPQNGQFLSIGIFLWHRNYSHINIYWHPWFGPIFSTFGYLEVSFAHNFFILLRMSWKEPTPLLGGTLPINLTNISVVWQNPTAHDMEAPCREVTSSFSVTMSGDAHSCICIQIMCVSHLYLILMFIFADVHNFSLVINAQTSIGLL